MVLVTVRITVMVTVIVSMTLDALFGICILYFSSVAPLSLGSYHFGRFRFPDVICPAVEKTFYWCTRGKNYKRVA